MATRLDVPSGAVVVGVDGSGRSRRAADWAAREAQRRGAPLFLLCAAEWPVMVEGMPPFSEAELVAPAGRTVAEELERLHEKHPDVTATGAAVPGRPSVVLVEASERASVLVVGARGLGSFAGPLLGSVSQKVTAHAQSPVVVVREEAPLDLPGPVVVGADPADPPVEALEFALDEARRRGVGLVVVASGLRPTTPYAYSPAAVAVLAQLAEEDRASLARMVKRMADARCVDVEVRHVPGHPVDAILEVAGNESLVVVGSRGRGGLASLLLGSVSRGVLHRAPAAVVVRVFHKPVVEHAA